MWRGKVIQGDETCGVQGNVTCGVWRGKDDVVSKKGEKETREGKRRWVEWVYRRDRKVMNEILVSMNVYLPMTALADGSSAPSDDDAAAAECVPSRFHNLFTSLFRRRL